MTQQIVTAQNDGGQDHNDLDQAQNGGIVRAGRADPQQGHQGQ